MSAVEQMGKPGKMSSLIEQNASAKQKESGWDVADYLIKQQQEILQMNYFVDSYNAKLERVLKDEKLFEDFNSILDEQKAILMINRGTNDADAEAFCMRQENICSIVQSL